MIQDLGAMKCDTTEDIIHRRNSFDLTESQLIILFQIAEVYHADTSSSDLHKNVPR